MLLRSTFEDTSSTMSACFFNFFSPVYAAVKQTPVLSSTPHKKPVRKSVLSIFSKDTTTKCLIRGSNQQPYDHKFSTLTKWATLPPKSCETETCAVMKQTLVLSFHTMQRACKGISIKCLSQGHNNIMPDTGIKPTTLQSPAQHSNQMGYTAAKVL